jgi:hypothetical protein
VDNRKKSVYFISGKHGIIENKGARNAVNMLNGLTAPLNETVTNCHNDHENQKKEAAGNG